MLPQPLQLLLDIDLIKPLGSSFCVNIPNSSDELQSRLVYYRKSAIRMFEKRLGEGHSGSSSWNIYCNSLSSSKSIESYLISSLLCDSCNIDDPLARICPIVDEMGDTMAGVLGLNSSSTVDSKSASNAIQLICTLAPLIRNGMITLLPLSCLHQGPMSKAIRYDPHLFESEVPESIKHIVSKNVNVLHGETTGDGQVALYSPKTQNGTSRVIGIAFDKDKVDGVSPLNFYLLSEVDIDEYNSSSGEVKFSGSFDESSPISNAYYNRWVTQSINQTVGCRLRGIVTEMQVAKLLNSRYITNSEFESEIASASANASGQPSDVSSLNLLNSLSCKINLVDPEHIVKIRSEFSNNWDDFRESLNQMAARCKDDPGKAMDIIESEINPRIRQIEIAAQKIRTGTVSGLGMGVITLGFTALAGVAIPALPALGLVGLTGLIGAYPGNAEYKSLSKGTDLIWSRISKL